MKKRDSKTSAPKENLLPDEGSRAYPEGPEKAFDQVVDELGFGYWQMLLITLCGFGTMVESMEVNLLSYIAPCAEEEWDLDGSETSWVIGTVFVGEILGSCVFGILADRHGRKFCFAISLSLMIIGGLATYYAQTYWELLVYRGLVGFGVAGAAFVAFDYLAENVPAKLRGKALMFTGSCWGIGSLLTSALAWLFLDSYGWHFVALTCSIPVVICALLLFTITESPRWLHTQGMLNETIEALKYGEKLNRKDIGPYTLIPTEKGRETADVRELFSSSLLRPTLQLILNWFIFGFTYYAIVVLIAFLLETSDSSSSSSDTCSFEYGDIAISAASEVIGPIVALAFVDKSRKNLQIWTYFASGLFSLLLATKNISDSWLTVIAFLARGMINIASNTTWVTTPEFYPTEIRATAHAFLYLVARVGALLSSFWVYSGLDSLIICIGIAVPCSIAAINTMSMKETAGLVLDDIQGSTTRVKQRKRVRTEEIVRQGEAIAGAYRDLDDSM